MIGTVKTMSLLIQDQINLCMERRQVLQALRAVEQDIQEHGSTWPLRRRWQRLWDKLQYIESTGFLVKQAIEVERTQGVYQSMDIRHHDRDSRCYTQAQGGRVC